MLFIMFAIIAISYQVANSTISMLFTMFAIIVISYQVILAIQIAIIHCNCQAL